MGFLNKIVDFVKKDMQRHPLKLSWDVPGAEKLTKEERQKIARSGTIGRLIFGQPKKHTKKKKSADQREWEQTSWGKAEKRKKKRREKPIIRL